MESFFNLLDSYFFKKKLKYKRTKKRMTLPTFMLFLALVVYEFIAAILAGVSFPLIFFANKTI
jgi:MFS superfamily sulfate permease-like transporter